MTLAEWTKQTGIIPTHPTTETQAVSVIISHRHLWRNALWKLTDFIVSSAAGDVIWLIPRR